MILCLEYGNTEAHHTKLTYFTYRIVSYSVVIGTRCARHCVQLCLIVSFLESKLPKLSLHINKFLTTLETWFTFTILIYGFFYNFIKTEWAHTYSACLQAGSIPPYWSVNVIMLVPNWSRYGLLRIPDYRCL